MTMGLVEQWPDEVTTASTMDVRMLLLRASRRGVPTMEVADEMEVVVRSGEVKESTPLATERDGEEMLMRRVPPSPPSRATRMEVEAGAGGEADDICVRMRVPSGLVISWYLAMGVPEEEDWGCMMLIPRLPLPGWVSITTRLPCCVPALTGVTCSNNHCMRPINHIPGDQSLYETNHIPGDQSLYETNQPNTYLVPTGVTCSNNHCMRLTNQSHTWCLLESPTQWFLHTSLAKIYQLSTQLKNFLLNPNTKLDDSPIQL